MNSEQEPDLLGVWCDPDPDKEMSFFGGVLGTVGGMGWGCNRGGEDAMGGTASEANTGRAGGGSGTGAFRAALDDNGSSDRRFVSAVVSSSSEESLDGPSARWCLRFALAASRRLSDT